MTQVKLHDTGLPQGAIEVGVIDPNDTAEIIVVLRRSPNAVPANFSDLAAVGVRPSPQQFEKDHGAHPDEVKEIIGFLTSYGVNIVNVHIGAKQITAWGTLAVLNKAFGIDLRMYHHQGRTFRHHAGPTLVPANVRPYMIGVLGLSNRPVKVTRHAAILPPNTVPLTVQTVCGLYNFPTGGASGQNIAIYEVPDLSTHNLGDIESYFSTNSRPLPTITNVIPPTGTAGDPTEANLDICVAGDAASGAQICMYYTGPNSSLTFADIIAIFTRMVHPQSGDPVCQVITVSYGFGNNDADGAADPTDMNTFNQVFQDAAGLGVSVFNSTGDMGTSVDGSTIPAVSLPSALPWLHAIGGTVIGNINGSERTEWLWNNGNSNGAGGGGVSTYWPVPSYQASINPLNITSNTAGRGIPDFSGNASPNSGYSIPVNGVVQNNIGGTSSSCPLMAAMIAVINKANGKSSGFINPVVYANTSIFLDITPSMGGPVDNSQNGLPGYPVKVGWDGATGLGVPDATLLKNVLAATSSPPPAPPPSPSPPAANESPNGTTLTTTTGTIIDASLNTWQLVASAGNGLIVYENGSAAAITSNVILLLYWNHNVYQENNQSSWWVWNGTWLSTSDPRPAPPPAPPSPPPVPSPPSPSPPAPPGSANLTLSWSLPSSYTVGSSVTYVIEYKIACDFTWSTTPLYINNVPSSGTDGYTIPGLLPNTIYAIRVNANGSRFCQQIFAVTGGGSGDSPSGTLLALIPQVAVGTSNVNIYPMNQITDSAGGVWTFNADTTNGLPSFSGVLNYNGTIDNTESFSEIIHVYYINQRLYAQSKDQVWYTRKTANDPWAPATDPRAGAPSLAVIQEGFPPPEI